MSQKMTHQLAPKPKMQTKKQPLAYTAETKPQYILKLEEADEVSACKEIKSENKARFNIFKASTDGPR